MDKLAVFGAIIAFVAIGLGYTIEGGVLANLFDLSAFIIVFGGTLGAAILHTPGDGIRRALQILSWVIRPPKKQISRGIKTVVSWSKAARKDGVSEI